MYVGSEMYWDKLELTITSWTLESSGCLFEYKSEGSNHHQHFRGTTFLLPLPHTEVYYFFHLTKKKVKEDRYEFFLERRKKPVSDLACKPEGIALFRLMGGVKLSRCSKKGREFILAEPLAAVEIERRTVKGKYEEMELSRPYAVVRAFREGYPVRKEQMLRFGKVEFKVVEVNTSLVREVDYAADDQQVLNLDAKDCSLLTTEKQAEDGQHSQNVLQCRFCLADEETEQNMLVAPCLCSGTGRHVHLQCLREWIQQKLNKMRESDGAFYQTSLLFCEICHHKFPRAVIKNGKTYGLLKFLEDSAPYIALATKDKTQDENMFYISFEDTKAVRVGRLVENGVVLEEQSVSRRHALIELAGDKMLVKDEESKYGTLVHEREMKIRLGPNIKAFQIANIVFSLKVIQDRNY